MAIVAAALKPTAQIRMDYFSSAAAKRSSMDASRFS
jgi:hypothetical protein